MPKARQTRLRAGVARANITPSVGIDLVGFAGRGPSVGIGDELYATALVLADGRERVAVLHLDLIGLDAVWSRRACELIAKRGRLPADNILLCCTHTHYGPSVRGYDDDPNSSPEAAYMAELRFKLAGVVQEACTTLAPVTARVAHGSSDIGINRRERLPDGRIILGRNPTGPIDREVILLRLDRPSGEPLCCLLNFATHAVSQTHKGRLISADFPGYAREVVESLTGATCLYLQGACGNINSVIMQEGLDSPRTLGKRLGPAAVQAFETAEPVQAAPLGVAHKEAKLPAKTYASVAQAQAAVDALQAEHDAVVAQGGNKGRLFWAQLRLDRAKNSLESLRTGKSLPPVLAPVWGVALGDVGIATGPGEIFCEIGMAVKGAGVFPHTMYASNTNGSIGYVPVPEAYPEGGYEVDSASRVGPGAAELVTTTAIAMLRRARSQARRKGG
jgi:neutral ceramidase